jgi:hypothetical protein
MVGSLYISSTIIFFTKVSNYIKQVYYSSKISYNNYYTFIILLNLFYYF